MQSRNGRKEDNALFNDALYTILNCYMASDIWYRTTQIARGNRCQQTVLLMMTSVIIVVKYPILRSAPYSNNTFAYTNYKHINPIPSCFTKRWPMSAY